MSEFTFKVNLVAVVRVRAADESVARQVVSTILGAPGTVEIGLANENNAAVGNHATITDVDSLSLLGRSSALGARLKIRQHYSGPLAFGGNNSSSLGARLFCFTALGDSFTRHQGLESAVDRPTNVVAYDRKLSRPLVLSYGKSRACGTGVSFPRTPDGRGCAP